MKPVFFDIDTQNDFMLPAGALYVPGAEKRIDAVAALNRHAATRDWLVVSTTDAHTENDGEFQSWPAHCVAGTMGQRKPETTLLDSPLRVPSAKVAMQLQGVRQVILEKQALDCFTNVNLPALLEQAAGGEYIVYGVVTEYCVRCALAGLLKTGNPVSLVTDAVQSLRREDAGRTIAEFTSAGGRLTTVSAVCL